MSAPMTWKQQEPTGFRKWVQREMLIFGVVLTITYLILCTCIHAYMRSCIHICSMYIYMYINTYICSSRGMLDVSGKCCLLEFFGWTLLKYLFIAPPTIKAISDITLQNLCKFIQNNILFTLLWNVSAMRRDLFPNFYKTWWI